MASRAQFPNFKAFDINADLLIGGKLHTYIPGTTNDKATYRDSAESSAHTNPIILNALGESEIFITGATKFVLTDVDDVPVETWDFVEKSSSIEALLVKNVAGAADVTLTEGEYSNSNMRFIGLLTANIIVFVPTTVHNFTVDNQTTGAFTLTVKPSSGLGIVITQGISLSLYGDGADIIDVNADKANLDTNNEVAELPAGAAAAEAVDVNHYMRPDGTWVDFRQSWTAITLLAGHSNSGAPRHDCEHFEDVLGFGNLHGNFTGGTVTNGTVIATLPVGARPAAQETFTCFASDGVNNQGVLHHIDVLANGDIKLIGSGANNDRLSLDGIRFQLA